jgi:hypothetical protein
VFHLVHEDVEAVVCSVTVANESSAEVGERIEPVVWVGVSKAAERLHLEHVADEAALILAVPLESVGFISQVLR